MLAIGLWVFWRYDLGKAVAPLSVALVLIPSLALALMIHLTDGGQSNYFYGLILLMIIVHMLGFNFVESLIYCLTVIFAYSIAVVSHDGFASDDLRMLVRGLFFLITSGVVCTLICYLNRQNRWKAFRLQRNAEQQSQRRLDFLADVSHELRTPLTLIAAPLDVVLSEPGQLRESVGQQLAIMRRNVDRLRLLVDDVLDVVRDRTDNLTLQREEIDVREFLQQIVTLTDDAARAIETTLLLQGSTEPMEISGDRTRLERVMSNLIGNAMKFSPAGTTIVIRLSAESSEALIEVMDEGPGIPEDFSQQIFERSFQADNVPKDATARGLGLGLAIAKKIVSMHGGRMDAMNRESGGAIFRVWLPLMRTSQSGQTRARLPASEVAYPPTAANKAPTESLDLDDAVDPPTTDSVPKIGKVLIIDDEPELRAYLADSLRNNHQVETARSASEGIERALAMQPDCILLDLMLPDATGFSALHRLRSEEWLSDTKILMLTANADETIKLAALREGASDFLSKPFGISELRARVNGLVTSSRMQKDLREEKLRLAASLKELKESELKLLHSEKMRSIADVSAGLLHEINNPVNFSLMAISVLQRRFEDDSETSETIDDISAGVTRIGEIVTDLRAFAHPNQQRAMTVVHLPEVVQTARRFAAGELDGSELIIEEDGPLSNPIEGSKSELVQLFLNVILNAKNAIDPNRPGKILIDAVQDAGRLMVTVTDNGVGMTQEQLARVREPFFSSDNQRGFGLGIPICQSIVENHGGTLFIESQPGEGTKVSFDFEISYARDQIPTRQ